MVKLPRCVETTSAKRQNTDQMCGKRVANVWQSCGKRVPNMRQTCGKRAENVSQRLGHPQKMQPLARVISLSFITFRRAKEQQKK